MFPHNELLVADQTIAAALGRPGRACLTCSFQLEDMVVLDRVRRLHPEIAVLFLDTGYHFAETYAYRDTVTARWRLNLVNLAAEQTVAEQEAAQGLLHRTDPMACCHLRKVMPLHRELAQYGVWFTGLRREQSPSRRDLHTEAWQALPSGHRLWKVSPLAAWTWDQVAEYAAAAGIERLPLYAQGYTSIGCQPCTSIPAAGADPRSGRWRGAHTECGIHNRTL